MKNGFIGLGRTRMVKLSGAAAAAFVSVFGIALGVAAARAAEQSSHGWYTPEQAAHGHITFNSYCAECHRPDLQGAMGPALVGDAFLKTWTNRPLGDLFDFEHSRMPANNPGSVPEDKLWIITAYILQKNGFASGRTPLGPQAESRLLVASGAHAASDTATQPH